MKKHRKEKDFVHLPQFPGGKAAFREFIKDNLRYPEKAVEARVEGIVYLSYEVNDNGDVFNIQIIKGIGYGCDEEAVRVVEQLKYEKVKNRGMRVKSTVKTNIEFRLGPAPVPVGMNYMYSVVPAPPKKEEPSNTPPKGEVYSYTIKL